MTTKDADHARIKNGDLEPLLVLTGAAIAAILDVWDAVRAVDENMIDPAHRIITESACNHAQDHLDTIASFARHWDAQTRSRVAGRTSH